MFWGRGFHIRGTELCVCVCVHVCVCVCVGGGGGIYRVQQAVVHIARGDSYIPLSPFSKL